MEAPSWFTAEPRITASTGCPLRRASDSFSSIRTPAPSAQLTPSAASANDLHRPSGASPPWALNPRKGPGVAITVTPPARARVHSPERRAWAARCTATSEEEHAVSRVRVGPSRPRVYETRPDSTLPAVPVLMKLIDSGGKSNRLEA
ncbi:hypothetical protein Kisp01_22410 [Kineosporia sp. NBRC 101677]|nr:hypothetical protein Kisp01_22410 [Kineosporia sp. NBRC 101677]